MSQLSTKDQIIKAAEELMIEKSFNSVGLKQILDTVKVPKGSFYHYFSSKEQFGVELLKHYLLETTTRKKEFLLNSSNEANPITRLISYLSLSLDILEKANCRFPCLALKLASEVTDMSEAMRQELSTGLSDWVNIFKELLDEAVDHKFTQPQMDTYSEAQFLLDSWSGSIQRSVVSRNSDPLKNAIQAIENRMANLKP